MTDNEYKEYLAKDALKFRIKHNLETPEAIDRRRTAQYIQELQIKKSDEYISKFRRL